MTRRRTAYLDWSTLLDAFKGTTDLVRRSHEALELRKAIEAFARTGTLVLSLAHVSELVVWQPKASALSMAKWLDGLGASWARPIDPDNDFEVSWWMARELCPQQAEECAPIASALSDVLPPSGGSPTRKLTVSGFVHEAHSDDSVCQSREHALSRFRQLRADRAENGCALGQDGQSAVLEAKFRELILQKARALRLTDGFWRALDDAELSVAVDRVLADERSVPFNRLACLVVRQAAVGRQHPESNNFAQSHRSMGYDVQHLLGGAYCDVFTCDGRIDDAIGGFRKLLGFKPQLSLGRLGGQFVEELRNQLLVG